MATRPRPAPTHVGADGAGDPTVVLLPTATIRFVGRGCRTVGMMRRLCLTTDPSAGPAAPNGLPIGSRQVGVRIFRIFLLFRGGCAHIGVVADDSRLTDVRHGCLSIVCRDREWSRP